VLIAFSPLAYRCADRFGLADRLVDYGLPPIMAVMAAIRSPFALY